MHLSLLSFDTYYHYHYIAAASKTGQSEMGLTWNADEEEETEESPLLSPLPTVNTKFIVYSGHDATLVPMLVILDIYKGK